MKLIDSHCHLHLMDLTEFDNKLENVLALASEHQVDEMLCVCVDLDDLPKLASIVQRFPQVYQSVGIHPCHEQPEVIDATILQHHADIPRCIAIGETGLDYYHQTTTPDVQRARFDMHMQVAGVLAKPLIIHTRAAAHDTIAMMQARKSTHITGVMHCFTETYDVAKAALDLGFYISFAGIITFKNAHDLRDVVRRVPLDRILIETDAPYLAPAPFRGKQNHPGLVRYVADMVAEIHQTDIETVAQVTTNNFYRCFALPERMI